MPDLQPPTEIDGTPVYLLDPDHSLEFDGERWFTMLPEDYEDERIWEWSATTGRVLLTVDPGGFTDA